MTTLTDRDVLALTLWGEARGEPVEGRIAVACVIRSRLQTGRWGRTYTEVCRAPKQFSCWSAAGGAQNHQALMVRVGIIQAGAVPADPILRECYWIADGTISGALQDRVGGATHYYARWLPEPPAWANDGKVVAEVGDHRFLDGVA